MTSRPEPRREVPVASLLLTLLGIAVGLGLIFVGAGMEPITMLGVEVRPAVPLLLVYLAGMLVGRFGNTRR